MVFLIVYIYLCIVRAINFAMGIIILFSLFQPRVFCKMHFTTLVISKLLNHPLNA